LKLAQSIKRSALDCGFQVVFRPHPIERAAIVDRYGRVVDGVVIDTNIDIYESFFSANAVVGDVSTGMFESAGIVPRIFMWKTPKSTFVFPKHPFVEFGDFSELEDLISDRYAGTLSGESMRSIWLDDWKVNYANFVSSVIDLPS